MFLVLSQHVHTFLDFPLRLFYSGHTKSKWNQPVTPLKTMQRKSKSHICFNISVMCLSDWIAVRCHVYYLKNKWLFYFHRIRGASLVRSTVVYAADTPEALFGLSWSLSPSLQSLFLLSLSLPPSLTTQPSFVLVKEVSLICLKLVKFIKALPKRGDPSIACCCWHLVGTDWIFWKWWNSMACRQVGTGLHTVFRKAETRIGEKGQYSGVTLQSCTQWVLSYYLFRQKASIWASYWGYMF